MTRENVLERISSTINTLNENSLPSEQLTEAFAFLTGEWSDNKCSQSVDGICEYSPDDIPCDGTYGEQYECAYVDPEPVARTTPCDEPDQDGVHRCPYSEDPTGECCRN